MFENPLRLKQKC